MKIVIVEATFRERLIANILDYIFFILYYSLYIILMVYKIEIIMFNSLLMVFLISFPVILALILLGLGMSFGKFVIGLRVVNSGSYTKPSFFTLIYRGYIRNHLTITILFRERMIHDEITYLTVINARKSKGLKYLKCDDDIKPVEDEWRLK